MTRAQKARRRAIRFLRDHIEQLTGVPDPMRRIARRIPHRSGGTLTAR